MKMEKVETHYNLQLKASEYDYLNVVVGNSGRMKIKFLDERWRTSSETIQMLKEIIDALTEGFNIV